MRSAVTFSANGLVRPTMGSRGMYGLKLNRSHPLALGLVSAVLPMANGVYDYARPRFANPQSGTTPPLYKMAARGPAAALAQPSGFTSVQTADMAWTSGAYSALVFFYTLGTSGASPYAIFGRYDAPSNTVNSGWNITTNPSGSGYEVRIFNNNNSFARALAVSPVPTAGVERMLSFAGDGSSRLNIYADGVFNINHTSGNLLPAADSGSETLQVGLVTGTPPSVGQAVYVAYAWKRELTASEMEAFFHDPFMLFEGSADMSTPFGHAGDPDNPGQFYSWQTR